MLCCVHGKRVRCVYEKKIKGKTLIDWRAATPRRIGHEGGWVAYPLRADSWGFITSRPLSVKLR